MVTSDESKIGACFCTYRLLYLPRRPWSEPEILSPVSISNSCEWPQRKLAGRSSDFIWQQNLFNWKAERGWLICKRAYKTQLATQPIENSDRIFLQKEPLSLSLSLFPIRTYKCSSVHYVSVHAYWRASYPLIQVEKGDKNVMKDFHVRKGPLTLRPRGERSLTNAFLHRPGCIVDYPFFIEYIHDWVGVFSR